VGGGGGGGGGGGVVGGGWVVGGLFVGVVVSGIKREEFSLHKILERQRAYISAFGGLFCPGGGDFLGTCVARD